MFQLIPLEACDNSSLISNFLAGLWLLNLKKKLRVNSRASYFFLLFQYQELFSNFFSQFLLFNLTIPPNDETVTLLIKNIFMIQFFPAHPLHASNPLFRNHFFFSNPPTALKCFPYSLLSPTLPCLPPSHFILVFHFHFLSFSLLSNK